jgi:hypothetical protein
MTVEVFYNGKSHHVNYNAITGPILSRLYKAEGTYYNPFPSEWNILGQHRVAA